MSEARTKQMYDYLEDLFDTWHNEQISSAIVYLSASFDLPQKEAEKVFYEWLYHPTQKH